jgi:hypothetical protein
VCNYFLLMNFDFYDFIWKYTSSTGHVHNGNRFEWPVIRLYRLAISISFFKETKRGVIRFYRYWSSFTGKKTRIQKINVFHNLYENNVNYSILNKKKSWCGFLKSQIEKNCTDRSVFSSRFFKVQYINSRTWKNHRDWM